MSEQFDWCCLGEPPVKPSQDIWHAVRPQSTTTVCGLPVANPDEEWRWVDTLGDKRPCDNCDRIMAQKFGLGAIQSPFDALDFPIERLYALWGIEPAAALPATYLVPGEPTPQLNQGSSPQCVAYSTAALKLLEDRADQGAYFDFDEGTFFARIGGGSNGAIVRDAFAQLLKVGYPVRSIDDAAEHRIAAYYAVPITQADICAALMAFGPLVIGMDWDNSFFNPVNGVLRKPSGVLAGGHAIKAIGFDSRGLHLRNSWGASWGIAGDCYLPWAYLNAVVWEAWKAVDVIETPPPTPVSPEVAMHFLPVPVRIFVSALTGNASRTVTVAGVQGIPANAVGVACIVRVDQPSARGWVYVGPAPVPANMSTVDYEANVVTDGFPDARLTNGQLTLISTKALPRLVIDVTGYYV